MAQPPSTIKITFGLSDANGQSPYEGAVATSFPTLSYFENINVSGDYEPVPLGGPYPVSTPITSGAAYIYLDWPSKTRQGTALQWVLQLPDGSNWMGVVPEGVYTSNLDNLIQTKGWGPVQVPGSGPVLQGTKGEKGDPGGQGAPGAGAPDATITAAGSVQLDVPASGVHPIAWTRDSKLLDRGGAAFSINAKYGSTPGAIPDGVTDATAAIVAAQAAASAAGGGRIVASPGVYLITPASLGVAVELASNIIWDLRGVTFRVNPSVVDYQAVFHTAGGVISNVAFLGMVLDQNGQNNTSTSVGQVAGHYQFGIQCNTDGHGLILDECQFLNGQGVNIVNAGGPRMTDVWVDNCSFALRQNPNNSVPYDNSGVYISADRTTFIDNSITAIGGINPQRPAWTGVEIHAANYTVRGNKVNGYFCSIILMSSDLVASTATPTVAPNLGAVAAGNVDVSATAHQWAYSYVSNYGESLLSPALSYVVSGTAASVSMTIPTGQSFGGAVCSARRIYRSDDGGVTWFLVGTIQNNTTTAFTDSTSHATVITTSIPPVAYDSFIGNGEVVCSNNVITGANYGIRITVTARPTTNLTITDNVIGVSNADWAYNTCSGIGYNHALPLKNVTIHGNSVQFQDEGLGRANGYVLNVGAIPTTAPIDPNYGGGGIYINASAPVDGITITDNSIDKAPLKGIFLGIQGVASNIIARGIIAGNLVTNAGSNLAMPLPNRQGICLFATQNAGFVDIAIDGNMVTDTWPVAQRVQYATSIYSASASLSTVTYSSSNQTYALNGYLTLQLGTATNRVKTGVRVVSPVDGSTLGGIDEFGNLTAANFSSTAPATSPAISTPAGWDAAWRTALANRLNAPAKVLLIGDSIAAGQIAPRTAQQFDEILASTLRARYSTWGDYYSNMAIWDQTGPPYSLWGPLTGGGVFTGFGWHIMTMSSTLAGSLQGVTAQYASTALDILYVDSIAGSWQYQIDGGAWQTVTNTGGGTPASTSIKRISLTGLPNAIHALNWGNQSAANVAMLAGIAAYSGQSGGIGFARMVGAGWALNNLRDPNTPSNRLSLFSNKSPQNDATPIGAGTFGFPLGAHLAILELFANDVAGDGGANSVASFIETYSVLIQMLRVAQPGCSILFLIPAYPNANWTDNSTGFANQMLAQSYVHAICALAAEYNCAVLDIGPRWGPTPVARGYQQAGNIHPIAAGHASIANEVLALIG